MILLILIKVVDDSAMDPSRVLNDIHVTDYSVLDNRSDVVRFEGTGKGAS